jgi:hypothetical protein
MKYQIGDLVNGAFGDVFDSLEEAEAALAEAIAEGQPKQPRRVILAARVEPQIKAWLEKHFPDSVSHGVNFILAEYMAKHCKIKRVTK